MTASVRGILSELELAECLCHNARTKAERFDWSVVMEHWERLYNVVIKKKVGVEKSVDQR